MNSSQQIYAICQERDCNNIAVYSFTNSNDIALHRSHKTIAFQMFQQEVQEIQDFLIKMEKIAENEQQKIQQQIKNFQLEVERKIHEFSEKLEIAFKNIKIKIRQQIQFQYHSRNPIVLNNQLFQSTIARDIQSLTENNTQLKKFINSIYDFKEKQQQFEDNLINQLHKILNNKQKIKRIEIKANLANLSNIDTLFFSKDAKHASRNVNQNSAKMVKLNTTSDKYYALCEPSLKDNRIYKFTFKIVNVSISEICIGVCSKNEVQSKNFCYSSGEKYTKLFGSNGNIWTPTCSKNSGFLFSSGDKIFCQVEMNSNIIKFKKQGSIEVKILEINKANEIFICVVLRRLNDEIEILQNHQFEDLNF